ncbi:MAG: hypothetical protein QXG97_02775, partial [Nitrososphaerota archaeon]
MRIPLSSAETYISRKTFNRCRTFTRQKEASVIPTQLQVLIFLLSLWSVVYVLSRAANLERRGIEVNPLYLMVRTKRLNNFLKQVSRKYPYIWRMYGNLGVGAAVVEMALASYFLIGNLHRFLYVPQTANPVVPFVPGVTISLTWFPYILIAIGLAITVHELAHGIIASLENIPVKSAGIVFAPVTGG